MIIVNKNICIWVLLNQYYRKLNPRLLDKIQLNQIIGKKILNTFFGQKVILEG